MERGMDLIEENVKTIYSVDVLTAMRWVKSIWRDLDGSIIRNCWKHTGLLVPDIMPGNAMVGENVPSDGEDILGEQIGNLVPQRTRMSISELLNPNGKDDCVQDITEGSMAEALVTGDREGDDSDDEVPLPALNECSESTRVCWTGEGKRWQKQNGYQDGAPLSLR